MQKSFLKLTDQNETCSLEQSFVIPVGVHLLQHITHTVVFPQPNGGIHNETRDQAERLVAHSEAVRVRHMRRVEHFNISFLYCWGVHLSIHDLQSYTREEATVRTLVWSAVVAVCATFVFAHT